MSIKSGRYGELALDLTPTSPVNPVAIVSINGWKLSLKTDYEEVTCFQDTNKVYVPGLRDISGTFTGFWNSAELTPIHGSALTDPPWIRLTPNTNEDTFIYEGLGYIDADIDCSLGAPKLSGTFKAAGDWTTP